MTVYKVTKSQDCMLTPQQLYEVVNDIDEYKTFLPGCLNSKTLAQGSGHKIAELTLGKGPLKYAFTTKNTLVPFESMQLSLQSGPFKTFEGSWVFKAIPTGCYVAFELTFAFSNPMLSFASTKLIYGLTDHIVDAFIERGYALNKQ